MEFFAFNIVYHVKTLSDLTHRELVFVISPESGTTRRVLISVVTLPVSLETTEAVSHVFFKSFQIQRTVWSVDTSGTHFLLNVKHGEVLSSLDLF